MARRLQRFLITPQDGHFRLQIEDEEGDCTELEASREQVELITDELDELLASSETEQGDA